MKRLLFLLLIFSGFFSKAQNILQTTIEKDTVNFSEPFKLFVKVPNTTLSVDIQSVKGGIQIINQRLDTNKKVLELTLLPLEQGKILNIPSIQINFPDTAYFTDSLKIYVRPYMVNDSLLEALSKDLNFDTNIFVNRGTQPLDSFWQNNKNKFLTAQQPIIFDIKKNFDAPLTFKEFWLRYRWLLLGIVLAAILGYIIYLIIKKLKQKREEKQKRPEINIPPDQWAIQELDKLKNSDYIANAQYKEFYFNLTYIVKRYLELRYKTELLELTTNETLYKLKQYNILPQEILDKLQTLLKTADLAKFAKYKPSPHEIDLTLNLAYDIVDKTKPVVEQENNKENGMAKDNI